MTFSPSLETITKRQILLLLLRVWIFSPHTALFIAWNNGASVGQQRIVLFMHPYPAQCLHLLVLAALCCWLLARKWGLCCCMEQGRSEDERWQPDSQITSASLENSVDISLYFKGCLEFQELGPGARAGAYTSILAIPILLLRSNAAPEEGRSLVQASDTDFNSGSRADWLEKFGQVSWPLWISFIRSSAERGYSWGAVEFRDVVLCYD